MNLIFPHSQGRGRGRGNEKTEETFFEKVSLGVCPARDLFLFYVNIVH